MNAQFFAVVLLAMGWLRSAAALALVSVLLGFGLLLAGVHMLFGLGTMLVVASLPPLGLAYVLAKGLTRG